MPFQKMMQYVCGASEGYEKVHRKKEEKKMNEIFICLLLGSKYSMDCPFISDGIGVICEDKKL